MSFKVGQVERVGYRARLIWVVYDKKRLPALNLFEEIANIWLNRKQGFKQPTDPTSLGLRMPNDVEHIDLEMVYGFSCRVLMLTLSTTGALIPDCLLHRHRVSSFFERMIG